MKTVLFVCVGNSGRSQMAEAFFNELARGRANAVSAGTNPAQSVAPDAVLAMKEVGIDISNKRPKPLTEEMLAQTDRMVTMGCGAEGVCPVSFVSTEDWGLEDPKGKSLDKVREIRDEIRLKVAKMLERPDSGNDTEDCSMSLLDVGENSHVYPQETMRRPRKLSTLDRFLPVDIPDHGFRLGWGTLSPEWPISSRCSKWHHLHSHRCGFDPHDVSAAGQGQIRRYGPCFAIEGVGLSLVQNG